MKINKHNGFSLIELMIVVAIIGVLALIAMPFYNNYIIRLQIAQAVYELSIAKNKIETAYADGTVTDETRFILSDQYLRNYIPLNLISFRPSINSTELFFMSRPQYIYSDLFKAVEVRANNAGNKQKYTELNGYFGKNANKELHDLRVTLSRQESNGEWLCTFGFDTKMGDPAVVARAWVKLQNLAPVNCRERYYW